MTTSTIMLIGWPNQDEFPLSRLFQKMPSPRPYPIIWERCPDVAFELCLTIKPAVIVIKRTIQGPDDGIILCQRIRSHPALHALPCIIGWIDPPHHPYEQAVQDVQRAGANGWFGRVYRIDGICTMIDQLVVNPRRTGLHDQ